LLDLENWRDGPESNSQGLTGATGEMMGVRRDESPFSIPLDHRVQAIGLFSMPFHIPSVRSKHSTRATLND
jgi:hypothetical protein